MKQVITSLLLLFVVASLVYVVMNERRAKPAGPESAGSVESPTNGPDVVVYYFHGNMRCKKCLAMEEYARNAVETHLADKVRNNQVGWRTANFDAPENEHFVRDYELTASSVVLVHFAEGKPVAWKSLDRIWDLVHDEGAFKDYIAAETLVMLEPGS